MLAQAEFFCWNEQCFVANFLAIPQLSTRPTTPPPNSVCSRKLSHPDRISRTRIQSLSRRLMFLNVRIAAPRQTQVFVWYLLVKMNPLLNRDVTKALIVYPLVYSHFIKYCLCTNVIQRFIWQVWLKLVFSILVLLKLGRLQQVRQGVSKFCQKWSLHLSVLEYMSALYVHGHFVGEMVGPKSDFSHLQTGGRVEENQPCLSLSLGRGQVAPCEHLIRMSLVLHVVTPPLTSLEDVTSQDCGFQLQQWMRLLAEIQTWWSPITLGKSGATYKGVLGSSHAFACTSLPLLSF